jgi:hypothetical protein
MSCAWRRGIRAEGVGLPGRTASERGFQTVRQLTATTRNYRPRWKGGRSSSGRAVVAPVLMRWLVQRLLAALEERMGEAV